MRRFLLFCALCLLALKARADFPVLDPNATAFPRASLNDFSNMVPAPAGTKGFLQTNGAHFQWSDGTRARFWGINVANTSLQESDENIVAMLRNFRAAGFNLVRLHHFDERGGIIDQTQADSKHFDQARLKKLDFWIAKARENGLYVYLDLLDYRLFKEGDGVRNADAIGRSAKPYAVFDDRLISLQKDYARALMRTHKNAYTGLSYADDPTIVMLEIYDENGLFMRRGLWRSMPEPYGAEFKAQWNDWLKKQYGSNDKLRAAWTQNGQSSLGPNESLENGSVEIPAMTWTPNQLKPEDRPFAASARKFDGARFAFDVHRSYFAQMKSFLRDELKIQVPLCATGRYDDLPDLSSQAKELDFIGCNFYYDHPYWGTGLPSWKLPSYYHGKNPISDLGEQSMAATLGLARVSGKPFVVREWNYCWPNTNRAAGTIEAATFGAMQDIDAMILFVYETNPSARLGYFNVRSDPARWGLAALGGQIFMQGLVAPLRNSVVVPYSTVDLFTYEKPYNPLYNLGWTVRMQNAFFDGDRFNAPDGTDLILPTGRSATGVYAGAPSLLYGRDLRGDGANNGVWAPAFWRDFDLTPRATNGTNFVYNGTLYSGSEGSALTRSMVLDSQVLRQQGLVPIGENTDQTSAHGVWDAKKRRLAFTELGRDEVLGAALDTLKLSGKIALDTRESRNGIFRSDTREVRRDAKTGRFEVLTPRVQVLAGNLNGARGFANGLQLDNVTQGAIVALSLDGKPLEMSQHFVVKMASDAHNSDEVAGRDPRFLRQPTGQFRLDSIGQGPVATGAKAATLPLEVRLGDSRLLQLWQTGSAWELLVENGKTTFWCDSPGAKFRLGDENSSGSWRLISAGKGVQISNSPLYPKGALAIQATN
ncbi:hypothetical protein IAD21_04692 [Abditibacteriota bacterium]|nr:hypothetical protein IAD21_04692 [Abditibacteriota bacterium]